MEGGDELLDYDALEALLDTEEDTELQYDDDAQPKASDHSKVPDEETDAKLLEEFFNEASDSDDESEINSAMIAPDHLQKSSLNQSEMNDSILSNDLEQKNSYKQIGNKMSTKKDGSCINLENGNKTTKSKSVDDISKSTEDDQAPQASQIHENIAQMEAQMRKLQKELELQKRLASKVLKSETDTSCNLKKSLKNPEKIPQANDNDTNISKHLPSQRKKIFQEQLGKKSSEKTSNLQLVSDVGESPFFDVAPSKSPLKGNKSENTPKSSKNKSERTPKSSKNASERTPKSSKNMSEKTPKSSKNKLSVTQKEEMHSVTKPSTLNSKKAMERALFGDDDSDWDDLDGEDKQTLNEAGQDLRRIMNSQKSRVAHQSKFDPVRDTTVSGQQSNAWARYYSDVESDTDKARKKRKGPEKHVKNALQCKSSPRDQIDAKGPVIKEENELPSVTEDYSKIRIINPLISSSLMKMRMEGRQMIGVPRIRLKMKTQEMQGDWVTIGVVVSKGDPKTSSAGKPYSIWRLNDLEDLDNSASFFLFGEVHKQLWKTEIGTVIGVLNPSLMDSSEKSGGGEPAFTIKNPSQMMVMGRSKDLAWCISLTKGGNKCNKFINRRQGEHCAYHVQAAYKKTSATRLELHGSIAGSKPKSFQNKLFGKDSVFHYGGQTFVPNSRAESGKGKKPVTLSKLQKSMGDKPFQKVNTLSIQDIKLQPKPFSQDAGPNLSGSGSGRVKEEPDDTFLSMIAVPSPGSMQLVASIKKQTLASAGSKSGGVAGASLGLEAPMKSVTPRELMRNYKNEMDEKKRLAQKRSRSSDSQPGPSVVDPLKQMPQLGKGFSNSQEIILGGSPRSAIAKADITKLKAIAAVRHKGGLDKADPNAVKKSGDKVQEKIKKKLETHCGPSSESQDSPTSSPSSSKRLSEKKQSGHSTSPQEPPKKKSKLLGDVDLNSDEIKSIMKAKSKHKGVLAQAEAEREEAYFTQLEKKEMLEEKMQSVTSMEITIVTCKTCMYTAQSAKESCKKEGHSLKRSKSKKRFFMCKKCKQRTFVIDAKFPTEPCRKCGATSYEKTSMCPIRSGPKLESEILNLRGDEMKYLNSMDQKVYLNTVIDD